MIFQNNTILKNVSRFTVLGLLLLWAGCRSAQEHAEQQDEAAYDLIADAQNEALGEVEDFTVEVPSDILRRRLMIDQQLPVYGQEDQWTNAVAESVEISFSDALMIAARNSYSYQNQKEDVFKSALSFNLQLELYANTYEGLLGGLFSSTAGDDERSEKVSGDASAGFSRKLKTGGSLAGKLSFDVMKLLTLDKSSNYGLLADATISIPLLNGAGREVASESLTQAERSLLYAIWDFEQYKKEFAVQIASSYYDVLQAIQKKRNAVSNLESRERLMDRQRELAKAGRVSANDVAQTEQSLLSGRNGVVLAIQSLESSFDGLKSKMGLPVDAEIDLPEGELEKLKALLENLKEVEVDSIAPPSRPYVLRAFENRSDMRSQSARVEDSERSARIAANALKAGLNFKASASSEERRYSDDEQEGVSFSDGKYNIALDADLPWDKSQEAKAYRESVLSMKRARRSFVEQQNGVKMQVRSSVRGWHAARLSCVIQNEAFELAQRRVPDQMLTKEAGRSSTRDLLDAQDDLLQASDSLTSALVSYRMAELNLLRETGTLEITPRGTFSAQKIEHINALDTGSQAPANEKENHDS